MISSGTILYSRQDWKDVRPMMEKYLNPFPLQILIYVDNYNDPKPEHEDITEIEKWIAGEGGLFFCIISHMCTMRQIFYRKVSGADFVRVKILIVENVMYENEIYVDKWK